MTADLGAVLWKEIRELWRSGSGRASRGGVLVTIVVFGVVWPLMFGESLLQSPLTAAPWLWVPMLLIGQVVIDAFAGERDRHTLETLLSTRLSDWSIVGGKLIAAIGYGAVLALVVVVLGIGTLETVVHHDRPLALDPAVASAIAIVFLLMATLVAAVAALVAVKASVRQAAQLFGVGLVALTLVPVVVANLLPADMRASLESAAAGLSPIAGFALVVLVLAAVDALLVAAVFARFRRADLVLD